MGNWANRNYYTLIYTLLREFISPQAFEGLRLQNRKLRRPDLTFATLDHNVPTIDIFNIKDEIANKQITTLQKNAIDFGVTVLIWALMNKVLFTW
ncbi:aconitase family protein [Staphylococcus aureus]